MEKTRQFVVKHLWWVVLTGALALLVVHSIGVTAVIVDNTSLVLLLIILASPFIAAIRKIKIGEFEAEIQPDEVKRVTQKAEEALPRQLLQEDLDGRTSDAALAILDLVQSDPVVALAKLRIEVESRLRRLAERAAGSVPKARRPTALTHVVRGLVGREILDQALGSSLLDVIAICNRAIHGEDIRDVDARQIAETGTELLEALERTLRDYAVMHPVASVVISNEEADTAQSARYRLTTVVPLVDEPKQNVYELTQEELDDFFEGYSEFAEFAVRLERIAPSDLAT